MVKSFLNLKKEMGILIQAQHIQLKRIWRYPCQDTLLMLKVAKSWKQEKVTHYIQGISCKDWWFSLQKTCRPEKTGEDILKCRNKKKKDCQSRILYWVKFSFKNEGEIKMLPMHKSQGSSSSLDKP